MDERVEPGITDIGNVRRHIARYNLALALCDKKNVLDLACGEGYGTHLISQIAFTVTGIDLSEDTIAHALPKYESSNTFFECWEASEYAEAWRPDPYDTLVCFETLEHLDDDKLLKFTRNIPNKIKTGGHIIYSVPLDEEKGWNPHHKQVFTLETVRDIFDLKFVDEFIQVGLNFYHIGEQIPEGKRFYVGIRRV